MRNSLSAASLSLLLLLAVAAQSGHSNQQSQQPDHNEPNQQDQQGQQNHLELTQDHHHHHQQVLDEQSAAAVQMMGPNLQESQPVQQIHPSAHPVEMTTPHPQVINEPQMSSQPQHKQQQQPQENHQISLSQNVGDGNIYKGVYGEEVKHTFPTNHQLAQQQQQHHDQQQQPMQLPPATQRPQQQQQQQQQVSLQHLVNPQQAQVQPAIQPQQQQQQSLQSQQQPLTKLYQQQSQPLQLIQPQQTQPSQQQLQQTPPQAPLRPTAAPSVISQTRQHVIQYQSAPQPSPSLGDIQRQQMQQQHQQQAPQIREPSMVQPPQPASLSSYSSYHQHSNSPLYLGHNPFIEILRPHSYADDNIVTLNLSHSHIYEIDSEAFVGQRFEHIDLSNNKLGLIHSRSFRIGPNHSRHNPYNPQYSGNSSKTVASVPYPTRRPPPAHPKSVTIDFSHNPAIVALSGAFDQIDVPNCLLNFTNSTVELKFGAFKKYFKEHPGHIVDIESVDCCEQEWLLGYKHNFLSKTHCEHDPSLFLSKVSQQAIIDSCIAYVTSARHSMTIQGPSVIHQVAAIPRGHSNAHTDNQYLTYLILGGTAMILTSLSIYIIFYMFSLKAAFVYQMQNKS